MSTESKTSNFDVVIWRESMSEEALCAVLRGKKCVIIPKVSTLSHDVLNECQDKTVLVCGSYYEKKYIEDLVHVASNVLIFFYSDKEKTKYGDVKITIEPVLLDEGTKKMYSWSDNLQKGILAGKNPGSDLENEALYRGFIYQVDSTGLSLDRGIEELKSKHETLIPKMLSVGHAINNNNHTEARKNVELSGKIVTINKYSACLVVGSVTPIMPLATAAAEKADIGINMRYNLKTNTTSLTFYTLKPKEVDMSFIDNAPYNGGGSSNCKGVTRNGVLLPLPSKRMEEIFSSENK